MFLWILAKVRARRGGKYLDRLGIRWWDRVSVTSLKMGECDMCVLAQLFSSSYEVAVSQLFLSPRRAKVLGFIASPDLGVRAPRYYRSLNRAWQWQVKKRRILSPRASTSSA